MKSPVFVVQGSELIEAVDRPCTPRSCGRRFTSLAGFSLVEVMLSIGIVAFAVVGVLTAFPVGIEAARDSRDETTAALIADNLFTYLRSQPFNGPVVWPEVPMKRQTAGFKVSYTTPVANMYHYARDGRPANANSSADGNAPTGAYKGDEGYFGVRISVQNSPYGNASDYSAYYLKARDDLSWGYLTAELARVVVYVSWPARMPYNNRKFVRTYYSSIANLH